MPMRCWKKGGHYDRQSPFRLVYWLSRDGVKVTHRGFYDCFFTAGSLLVNASIDMDISIWQNIKK